MLAGVPVLTAGRAASQGVPGSGPYGGQHQHRAAAEFAQQLPQPGGEPIAQPRRRPGRYRTVHRSATPLSAARCLPAPAARPPGRTGRSDATAATASPGPAAGPAPPTRSGSCRGGPADQHCDPAVASRRRAYHRALHLAMLAAHAAATVAARAAHPQAAPAGAPPRRTGRSPHPAAAPQSSPRCLARASAPQTPRPAGPAFPRSAVPAVASAQTCWQWLRFVLCHPDLRYLLALTCGASSSMAAPLPWPASKSEAYSSARRGRP
jgi:hypothetical protein